MRRVIRKLENVMAFLNGKSAALEIGPLDGKIIGHTRSGKAIYDSYENRKHSGFSRMDHYDALNAHKKIIEHPETHADKIKHHKVQANKHFLHSVS